MSSLQEIKGEIAQRTVSRGAEGAKKYVRMLKDGSLTVADFMLACELEGLVKVAASGAAETTITCAGAYDADGEDFGLRVVSGITVMVTAVEVIVTSITDDEPITVLFMTSNTELTGTTGTLVTIKNKNNGYPNASSCICYVAYDAAGGTDVSGGSKAQPFFRDRIHMGTAVTANIEHQVKPVSKWSALKDGLPPIVVGPGAVAGHVTKTTAATAHITVEFIEFNSADLGF